LQLPVIYKSTLTSIIQYIQNLKNASIYIRHCINSITLILSQNICLLASGIRLGIYSRNACIYVLFRFVDMFFS
jgi:hypothetical protein